MIDLPHQIRTAFADRDPWVATEITKADADSALDLVASLSRMRDEDVRRSLPSLMLALHEQYRSERSTAVSHLIALLEVECVREPAHYDSLERAVGVSRKQAMQDDAQATDRGRRLFADFTPQQAAAILAWLDWAYTLSLPSTDTLMRVRQYWHRRAQSPGLAPGDPAD